MHNTGNTEDSYTATIIEVSGPVTASLRGLDGQPTQTIPLLRLPGLATGALQLDTILSASGEGRVTVEVTSQSNEAVTVEATATVVVPTGNQAPVADAGPDHSVLFGHAVSLNGRNSTDSDSGPAPLSFAWRFMSKPGSSALTDASIAGAASALASLMPDVRGDFTFELTVSDSALQATDVVVVHVLNNPPVANAGQDRNVQTDVSVMLDGSNSFDPDGDMLTYDWSLDANSAASGLSDAALTGRSTPTPSFTPDVDGTYRVQLIVNDDRDNSTPAFVTLTASTPNVLPNAAAGPDQNAIEGALVLRMDAPATIRTTPRKQRSASSGRLCLCLLAAP